jgi:hypothetical protein
MRRLRRAVALLLGITPLPALAHAQDSQFSLLGPGTPARFESVRARATGGAFAPFDALSWMTDAALVDLRRLTASAQGIASFRQVELAGADENVRSTRFPSLLVAAPLAARGRLVVAGGFGAYLDRTYRTALRDSALIRGEMEAYTDIIASDGGVSDVRLAGAWRLGSRVAAGAAFHLLAGATRSSAQRTFDDSAAYEGAFEVTDVQHTGMGVSGGVLLDVLPSVRIALWGRSDSELRVSVEDVETARYGLPTTVGGGLRWTLSPELRLAALVSQHTWADAGGRNTVEWAVGAEGGAASTPGRVGIRGATLPFGPAGIKPTEFAVAAGFARAFSEGRARIDLAVERITRSGGDLRENVWSVLLGFSLQP